MDRLLNRDWEMQRLNGAWEKAARGEPQLVVVRGRRRVGKTFMLSHFVSGKRSVFFGATEQAEPIELSRLLDVISRDLGARVGDLTGGQLASWEAALRFLAAQATDEPIVVVIDEVPYLTKSTPGFPSIVQAVWDHLAPGTKLMLVLTGSAVGVIEAMLGAGGALRGRPTLGLIVNPFDISGAKLFLSKLHPVALIEAYAACGGYPLHLKQWEQSLATDQNLLALAGTVGEVLLEDANVILREELPQAGGYSRILAAIGRGKTRYSEISSEASQRIEHPLEVLTGAGFVRKALPVGTPRGARASVYEIADPYLAFWFSVLYSDIPQIEAGQGKQVLSRKRPQWRRHLGWIFEELAREHASRLVANGAFPSDLVIGRWWASSGEPVEVDVLGLAGARTKLLGEARWQESPLDIEDLGRLQKKLRRVPKPVPNPLFALWGRGGVTRRVKNEGAIGYSAEDIIG